MRNLEEIEKAVNDFSKAIDLCLKYINQEKEKGLKVRCKFDFMVDCDKNCNDCEDGTIEPESTASEMEIINVLEKPMEQMKVLFLSVLENGTDKIRYFWDDIEKLFDTIENQIIGDKEFEFLCLEGLDNWQQWERAKRWFLEVNRKIKYLELAENYYAEKAIKELVEEEKANKTKADDQTTAETPKAAPAPVEKPLHFYCSFNTNTLTKIFEYLKNGRYFDADATLEAWLYICGVADLNSVFKPLNWISEAYLLGLLVKALFSKNKCWVITKNVFRVNGQEPTIDYLKTNCSKLNNNWKDGQKAEIFIKEIMAIK